MQPIGHRAAPLIAALARAFRTAASARGPAGDATIRGESGGITPTSVAWGIGGAIAAGLPAVWMWGFTVDDALIAIRYACHLAAGVGWRFNADGPSTDGVTPLPWPLLLVAFADADLLAVLVRAKALGLALWIGTGASLGAGLARARGAPRWSPGPILATVALSIPLAAYAVSGMETPVATLLATLAALSSDALTTATLAGLSAAFRPELGAWALTLAVGTVFAGAVGHGAPPRPVRLAVAVALSLAPWIGCALVRAIVWGRPAPLALLAKPSDIRFGLPYAGAAYVVTLIPLLVLAPPALRRTPRALVIVVAALAHAVAIAVAGGDWMPYARLAVPVLPSLAYAAGLLAGCASRRSRIAFAARSAVAVAVGAVLVARGGTSGRAVGADREALIVAARPWLRPAHRIATIDIGWVGAATDADIVDLAGLTDPLIAALPGGHTSKRVGPTLLFERDVDTLLLYASRPIRLAAWRDGAYPRRLEARLAADDVVARHFVPVAWLPLAGAGYVVLRRDDRPTGAGADEAPPP